ncbi:MAG: hypothetical protein IK045_00885 [Bacteroidales bacterium]|nr:hypothetical protein [Bacteroidales bacterium]
MLYQLSYFREKFFEFSRYFLLRLGNESELSLRPACKKIRFLQRTAVVQELTVLSNGTAKIRTFFKSANFFETFITGAKICDDFGAFIHTRVLKNFNLLLHLLDFWTFWTGSALPKTNKSLIVNPLTANMKVVTI